MTDFNDQHNSRLYKIRRSRIHGRGAFALTTIRKGQQITEYIGERIGPDLEAKRYNEDNMESHHTFLFSIDDYTTIDGGVGGNDARYINHSCDPNCEALDRGGRIFIHAMRTIRRGEELNYDYQFAAPGRITKSLREFYVCHCGTKKCRGTILAVKPSQNGNGKVSQHPGRHAEHARTKRSN